MWFVQKLFPSKVTQELSRKLFQCQNSKLTITSDPRRKPVIRVNCLHNEWVFPPVFCNLFNYTVYCIWTVLLNTDKFERWWNVLQVIPLWSHVFTFHFIQFFPRAFHIKLSESESKSYFDCRWAVKRFSKNMTISVSKQNYQPCL